MLDINYIRENANIFKTACENKQLDSGIIDELLAVDKKRRKLKKLLKVFQS